MLMMLLLPGSSPWFLRPPARQTLSGEAVPREWVLVEPEMGIDARHKGAGSEHFTNPWGSLLSPCGAHKRCSGRGD